MKIERHSPSSLALFAASPAMYVLEKILGKRQPVGSPAHRGIAVERGIEAGLNGSVEEDAITTALRSYDTESALSSDPRREQYRKTIPDMVKAGLRELLPYGKPTATQGFLRWHPDGLEYPVVGYFDFAWENTGVVIDLKTTEALPSQIKTGHARQVGFYSCVLGDNVDARLTYVTPKKVATYALENARAHRESLFKMAQACERFLALSDDPAFYVSITCPDLESFYWTPPAARQQAFDVWGI